METIKKLLDTTYWAKDRTLDTIESSINHSVCYGIYKDDTQVGFARCITDYTVMYWLADVVISQEHKNNGLGKLLVKTVVEDERFKSLRGFLVTKDAHGLYEQYGFYHDTITSMRRD